MKILMISHYYHPEDVGAAVQITEMSEDLVQRGHEVTVLTGFPHYPKGKVFDGYKIKLLQRETINGVKVLRSFIYINPDKVIWKRILNYGSLAISSLFSGLLAGSHDVIYVDLPPLPLGFTGVVLKSLFRSKLALNIHDVEPERSIELGVFTQRKFIRFLEWLELYLYHKAEKIVVVGETLADNLFSKNVSNCKVEVIPTWTDPKKIKVQDKNNSFREKHARREDFLIQYSGTIGYTSLLDPIIETANILRNDPAYRFMIIGEGVKKVALENRVNELGLTNVIFLSYQPFDKLSEILAAADLSLVTLDPALSAFSVPGKTYTIMASSRPVLALVDENTDVGRIIDAADCGVRVTPNDISRIVKIIVGLSENASRLEELGRNGRQYLLKYLSRDVCIRQHEQVLIELASLH